MKTLSSLLIVKASAMKTKIYFIPVLIFCLGLLLPSSLWGHFGLDSIPSTPPKNFYKIDHTTYTIKEGSRKMVIDFWYPTALNKHLSPKKSSFIDQSQFSDLMGMHHSGDRAPQAQDIKNAILGKGNKLPFPALVFFTDLGLDDLFTIAFYRKLAEKGFIVITIDLPDLDLSMA